MLASEEPSVFYEIPPAPGEPLSCSRYRYDEFEGLLYERAEILSRDPHQAAPWKKQSITEDTTIQLYDPKQKQVFTLEWRQNTKSLFVRGYPFASQHTHPHDGNDNMLVLQKYYDRRFPDGRECHPRVEDGNIIFARAYQSATGHPPGPTSEVKAEQIVEMASPPLLVKPQKPQPFWSDEHKTWIKVEADDSGQYHIHRAMFFLSSGTDIAQSGGDSVPKHVSCIDRWEALESSDAPLPIQVWDCQTNKWILLSWDEDTKKLQQSDIATPPAPPDASSGFREPSTVADWQDVRDQEAAELSEAQILLALPCPAQGMDAKSWPTIARAIHQVHRELLQQVKELSESQSEYLNLLKAYLTQYQGKTNYNVRPMGAMRTNRNSKRMFRKLMLGIHPPEIDAYYHQLHDSGITVGQIQHLCFMLMAAEFNRYRVIDGVDVRPPVQVTPPPLPGAQAQGHPWECVVGAQIRTCSDTSRLGLLKKGIAAKEDGTGYDFRGWTPEDIESLVEILEELSEYQDGRPQVNALYELLMDRMIDPKEVNVRENYWDTILQPMRHAAIALQQSWWYQRHDIIHPPSKIVLLTPLFSDNTSANFSFMREILSPLLYDESGLNQVGFALLRANTASKEQYLQLLHNLLRNQAPPAVGTPIAGTPISAEAHEAYQQLLRLITDPATLNSELLGDKCTHFYNPTLSRFQVQRFIREHIANQIVEHGSAYPHSLGLLHTPPWQSPFFATDKIEQENRVLVRQANALFFAMKSLTRNTKLGDTSSLNQHQGGILEQYDLEQALKLYDRNSPDYKVLARLVKDWLRDSVRITAHGETEANAALQDALRDLNVDHYIEIIRGKLYAEVIYNFYHNTYAEYACPEEMDRIKQMLETINTNCEAGRVARKYLIMAWGSQYRSKIQALAAMTGLHFDTVHEDTDYTPCEQSCGLHRLLLGEVKLIPDFRQEVSTTPPHVQRQRRYAPVATPGFRDYTLTSQDLAYLLSHYPQPPSAEIQSVSCVECGEMKDLPPVSAQGYAYIYGVNPRFGAATTAREMRDPHFFAREVLDHVLKLKQAGQRTVLGRHVAFMGHVGGHYYSIRLRMAPRAGADQSLQTLFDRLDILKVAYDSGWPNYDIIVQDPQIRQALQDLYDIQESVIEDSMPEDATYFGRGGGRARIREIRGAFAQVYQHQQGDDASPTLSLDTSVLQRDRTSCSLFRAASTIAKLTGDPSLLPSVEEKAEIALYEKRLRETFYPCMPEQVRQRFQCDDPVLQEREECEDEAKEEQSHTAGADGPAVPRWGVEAVKNMWRAVMGSAAPLPDKPSPGGFFEGQKDGISFRFNEKGRTEMSFDTLSRKSCNKAIQAIVKAWNARYPKEADRAGVLFVPTGSTAQIRSMVAEALTEAGYQLDTERCPTSKLSFEKSCFVDDEGAHTPSPTPSRSAGGGSLADILGSTELATGTGTGSSLAPGGR